MSPNLHWKDLVIGRSPKRTLLRLIVIASIAYIVFGYVFRPMHISGASMEPTYHDGSFTFICLLKYCRHPPERGSVVAIRYLGTDVMLLKRVIGLPGERIAFHDGAAYANGRPLSEPYVTLPCDWNVEAVEVGPEEYYVVGDNRSMPEKNHRKGRVSRYRVMGGPLF
ncbi:MAG: signal peptidase I [Planctomycetota bacterium]